MSELAGTPRWVKVLAAIGLVVAVLFVALHLTGNGPRSHGGHRALPSPSQSAGDQR